MDTVIEFFLKYRPAAFGSGSIGFAPLVPAWFLLLLGITATAAVAYLYVTGVGQLSARRRGVLLGLRVAGLSVLVFCLFRPVLIIAESVKQRNIVAIVVDDSRSMRVPDVAGQSRSTALQSLIGGPDSALIKALADRYQTRIYRTSGAGRVEAPGSLGFDGTRTRLLAAVERVEDELAGSPLAGVVVLSDGADNANSVETTVGTDEQLLTLRSRGIPVYTVGIGSTRYERDVEVTRVDVPNRVLQNSTVLVDVVIVQRGFGGARLPIVVEDSGRIVGTETVTMPRNGEATQVRIRIPATEPGARLLRVHVPQQDGEMIAENNERRVLLEVRDRREKVLYFEGEPRFELKFLRRAIEGDANVQLVTLLRSAREKFLRLGVDDSLELAAGFPATREELFSYRALVLGSIEASFFTADQLRMMADFVSERGGGFVALGGRSAFAEGGYLGTPLADVLPVELGLGVSEDTTSAVEVKVEPTALGSLHPALQIAGTDSTLRARWASLPPLTMVNSLLRAKPGATVLLNGRIGDGAFVRPLLTIQRYGRGRVMAFGTQDSWQWQMHHDVAVDDSTHETLWRQILRWAVSDVPDRVEPLIAEESGTGEALQLRAQVSDAAYLRANGASVSGTVVAPGGVATEVTFDWAVDRDGEYTATYVPVGAGVHEVTIRAIAGTDTTISAPTWVRIAEPTEEFFGSELRTSLLGQLAEETGGRMYALNNATDVARDIVYSPSGATVVHKNDLWDMPLLFLLLAAALGTEWTLRRRWGLV